MFETEPKSFKMTDSTITLKHVKLKTPETIEQISQSLLLSMYSITNKRKQGSNCRFSFSRQALLRKAAVLITRELWVNDFVQLQPACTEQCAAVI